MSHKYPPDPRVLVGLSDEPRETVEPYVSNHGIDDGIGYGSTSGEDYGVGGIPDALVIGPEGRIQWRGHLLNAEFDQTIGSFVASIKMSRRLLRPRSIS